jgi:hypothetical protein
VSQLNVGSFVLGGLVATFVVANLIPANESSCCQRVAFGARDKIAGLTGPFEDAASALLDATGITKTLPGLLDKLGVPKDF